MEDGGFAGTRRGCNSSNVHFFCRHGSLHGLFLTNTRTHFHINEFHRLHDDVNKHFSDPHFKYRHRTTDNNRVFCHVNCYNCGLVGDCCNNTGDGRSFL
mmetsp:Transcript_119152/g.282723  ORF Transcript_119152/g.282723 Transcript_119152/m.282723 type:complete len:99 (+) Transcript_119152:1470-1766(+)